MELDVQWWQRETVAAVVGHNDHTIVFCNNDHQQVNENKITSDILQTSCPTARRKRRMCKLYLTLHNSSYYERPELTSCRYFSFPSLVDAMANNYHKNVRHVKYYKTYVQKQASK